MNNLSIIDLDSMLYQSSGPDRLEDCMEKFRNKLNNCLIQTNADYWIGAVGKGKCFRYNIYPQYKSNRTRKPPKFLSALKEWTIDEFDLNVCIDYEADDFCKYWMNNDLYIGLPAYYNSDFSPIINSCDPNKPNEIWLNTAEKLNKILCAIDKDLLNSIPGHHFNYSYKIKEESKSRPKEELTEFDFDKGFWVETTPETSWFYEMEAMIVGDSADGISCLSGKGKVFAQKLSSGKSVREFELAVFDEYLKEFGNTSKAIYEYQKNYRLLHILESDEDFLREVGYIPEFPKINKIIKNNDAKIDF